MTSTILALWLFPPPLDSSEGDVRAGTEDVPDAIEVVESRPEVRAELKPGVSRSARMDAGTAGRLQGGVPFESYSFEAVVGMRVHARAWSSELDPALLVKSPSGTLIQVNDDETAKTGTDAGLEFFPPESGRYELWVSASDGRFGDYQISFDARWVQVPTGPLELGRTFEGWLVPGDDLNRKGLFRDRWTLAMPAVPVGIWAESETLDVYIKILSAEGETLEFINDVDPVGGNRNALLFLDPERIPRGAPLLVEVGSFGPGSTGSYRMRVEEFPLAIEPAAVLEVRLLRARGAAGRGGSRASIEELISAFQRAKQAWLQCGIELRLKDQALLPPLEIPGLEGKLAVDSEAWSEEEKRLLSHPLRLSPLEGGLTVFVVRETDGGEGHGLSYPTTRYSPRRTGIVVSDLAVQRPDRKLLLAHEIGHSLGLVHSSPLDGDPRNDTDDNLMVVVGEDQASQVGELTPFQCAIARRFPHLLSYPGGTRPRELFNVHDSLLQGGRAIEGTLADGDRVLSSGQLLDILYFEGKAGEALRIELKSMAFDAYLLLESAEGRRVAEDDDGGGGTQARLRVTLPEDGDYVVGVTATEASARGLYQIRLTRLGHTVLEAAGPEVSVVTNDP